MVVLPLPEGPTIANVSPLGTVKETSFRTYSSLPGYLKLRFSTTTAYSLSTCSGSLDSNLAALDSSSSSSKKSPQIGPYFSGSLGISIVTLDTCHSPSYSRKHVLYRVYELYKSNDNGHQ